MADTELASYLEPLRASMSLVEARITEMEVELVQLRKERTALGNALRVLDPQWAANHKPKKKKSGSSGHGVSDERLEDLAERLRRDWPTEDFDASMVSEATGFHLTTVHKLLKELRERGTLRLDHMGGQRKTTKFYRVVAADDA